MGRGGLEGETTLEFAVGLWDGLAGWEEGGMFNCGRMEGRLWLARGGSQAGGP